MTDQQRLFKVLREEQYHTPLQWVMAGIILKVNGIEAALDYARGATAVVSIEAAEELRDWKLSDGDA